MFCLSFIPAHAVAQQNIATELSRALSAGDPKACTFDRTVSKTKIKNYLGKDFEISSISYEYLDEIFDFLASQKHIPFNYPEDGCYARAHEMARLMEEKGIASGKTFIEGSLRVETQNSPKGYVEWWYHVAPIVAVKKSDGTEVVYVIDPSIFDKPVPVVEWYDIQTKHAAGKKDESYYTPRFSYEPIDKIIELDKFRDKDFKDVRSTMKRYLKIQEKRQKNNKVTSSENEL